MTTYTRSTANTEDIIDSRDIIDRIEELQSAFDDEAARLADDYPDAETANCGTCGRDFPDVFPGARCPYEYSHDESDELAALRKVAEQGGGSPDWNYGKSLIRDSYFEDYARELAEDIGAIPDGFGEGRWPMDYASIDWPAAADALKADYFDVDYDGVTYWIRG